LENQVSIYFRLLHVIPQLWVVKIENKDYNKEWSDDRKNKSLRRMPESPKNNGLEISACAGMTRPGSVVEKWPNFSPVNETLLCIEKMLD